MGGARTTLHVNVPLEMKEEMERVARELGLPSAAGYVAYLHSAMGIAVQLEEPERMILRELALYRSHRHGGTAEARYVANQTRIMKDYFPTAVRKLETRGLVRTDRSPRSDVYAMDFMMPDGAHVWVTPRGVAAAQIPAPLADRLRRSRVVVEERGSRPGSR